MSKILLKSMPVRYEHDHESREGLKLLVGLVEKVKIVQEITNGKTRSVVSPIKIFHMSLKIINFLCLGIQGVCIGGWFLHGK